MTKMSADQHETDLQMRVARCERTSHRLWILISLNTLALFATLWGTFRVAGNTSQATAAAPPLALRASEVTILDEKGIVRVRLGSQLPDAIINGKAVRRGDRAAGLLLYDETGQERGGYVTFSPSGYVALTLDTRERMVASFMAGPSGAGLVQLRNGGVVQVRRDNDWVELRADETGARLNAVHSKQMVFQEPALEEEQVDRACSEMKGELVREPRIPVERMIEACKERMPESLCRKCFTAR
jgi:hypothetical protein